MLAPGAKEGNKDERVAVLTRGWFGERRGRAAMEQERENETAKQITAGCPDMEPGQQTGKKGKKGDRAAGWLQQKPGMRQEGEGRGERGEV